MTCWIANQGEDGSEDHRGGPVNGGLKAGGTPLRVVRLRHGEPSRSKRGQLERATQ
jgi:hypothetical protein